MKTSFLWAIIALLVGASVFGIYQSLHLLKKNSDLSAAIDSLKLKLVTTEAFLNQTRESLRLSQIDNARLEDKNNMLTSKLSQKEKEVKRYQGNIAILTKKLAEATEVNVFLAEKNNEVSSRLLRLEFENAEMKNKFSSITELKKAIKELKIKIRHGKKGKLPVVVERKKAIPLPEDITNVIVRGNHGFLLKDGMSTFEAVNIRVSPVEETH